MRPSRWLIVNADDLGRSEGINRGIFEAHERGILTSTTLMVGFPAAVSAAGETKVHRGLGVGLHVTLTGAPPTLPAEEVRSLLDEGGRLPRRPEGEAGTVLDRADPAEVRAEVRNQLRRFRELVGRDPTHLDSHHHSHRKRSVLAALVEVANEAGIPVRRSSSEIASALSGAGVATTGFFDDSFYGEGVRLESLLGTLAGLPPGVTELMCHPGYSDPVLEGESGYAVARERELAILVDPAVRAAVEQHGIELISFAGLGLAGKPR